jgi:hypothetical protein
MVEHLGITFREGYTSFPEFKKEISPIRLFKKFTPEEREKELQTAWKKYAKHYGLSDSKKQGGKAKSSDSKQSVIPTDKES